MIRPVLAAAAPAAFPAFRLVPPMEPHPRGGAPPAHIGRVVFPTSCGPAAQAQIERGVALLHSFWFEEAGRAFSQAAAAESTCTMAHWGLASSYLHPMWAPPTPADLQQGAA